MIYLDLPEPSDEPVKSLDDKLQIEPRLKTLVEELDSLITELGTKGYKEAKRCLENAKGEIFTYVKTWLQSGAISPKVTSLVERMMREIKRRIKRIGFTWSEKGAQKMTRRLLMQLISTKRYWENHWNEKMGIDTNIKPSFLGIDVKLP